MGGGSSPWDRAITLNGLDARFWAHMPTPLAEVGTRLDAGRGDYTGQLLRLIEDAVALAGAVGLAQLPDGARARAYPLLERPALGSRIELLWLVEREHAGATGWDPNEAAAEQADFIALVNPSSAPRRPTTRHVFDAITKLRNDAHHRRLLSAQHDSATGLLEGAVFAMIRRNRIFFQRFFWVDEVRRTPDGGEELTAFTLQGPTMARFRRGHGQSTRAGLLPHRVVFGELEDPIDLHPFVMVRSDRVHVIDEMKNGVPVLRHFATRAQLEDAPAPEVGPPPSEPRIIVTPTRERAPTRPNARPLLLGCAALAVPAVVLLMVAAVMAVWPGADSSTAPELAPAPATVTARTTGVCPVTARPGIPAARDLPRLLTGAPVHWGADLDELTGACGAMEPVPMGDCRAPFVRTREASWTPTLSIPGRRSTHLSFHRSRGLFEVMVYSDARPFALAAAMEQYVGPPHHIGRVRHTWTFPQGADRPSMHLKVTGLLGGDERGNSVIRLYHPPTYYAYRAELDSAGCR